MTTKELRREFGVVFILDALGASMYSDEKIRNFLDARRDLNKILEKQASVLGKEKEKKAISTYTFGDTLIVVIPIDSESNTRSSIQISFFMMQNYIFYSMEKGILYRGAFSIGNYIADEDSNTVMGEAVSDAAAWYEKSEWMGVACTPRTNNIIEYEYPEGFNDPKFYKYYPVPMKDNRLIDLYTVSWAGRFFQEPERIPNPRQRFIELLKEHSVPFGTEEKIKNTKDYFSCIEKEINLTKQIQPTPKSGAADL